MCSLPKVPRSRCRSHRLRRSNCQRRPKAVAVRGRLPGDIFDANGSGLVQPGATKNQTCRKSKRARGFEPLTSSLGRPVARLPVTTRALAVDVSYDERTRCARRRSRMRKRAASRGRLRPWHYQRVTRTALPNHSKVPRYVPGPSGSSRLPTNTFERNRNRSSCHRVDAIPNGASVGRTDCAGLLHTSGVAGVSKGETGRFSQPASCRTPLHLRNLVLV